MATTVRFKLRTDTGENWTSKNPILAQGEPGYDSTENRIKFGNGVNAWNDLSYLKDDDTIGGSGGIEEAPEDGNVYCRGDKSWYKVANGLVLKAPTLGTLPVGQTPAWKVLQAFSGGNTLMTSAYNPNANNHLFLRYTNDTTKNPAVVTTFAHLLSDDGVLTPTNCELSCAAVSLAIADTGTMMITDGNQQKYTNSLITNLLAGGTAIKDIESNRSVSLRHGCYSPELKAFLFCGASAENIALIPLAAAGDHTKWSFRYPTFPSGAFGIILKWIKELSLFTLTSRCTFDNTSNNYFNSIYATPDGINFHHYQTSVSESNGEFIVSVEWFDTLKLLVGGIKNGKKIYVTSTLNSLATGWTALDTPFVCFNTLLAWSPDKKMLCLITTVNGVRTSYLTADLQNWVEAKMPTGADVAYLEWSPALKKFIAYNNVIYTLDVDEVV